MTFKNYRWFTEFKKTKWSLINDFREFGYKLDVVYGILVCCNGVKKTISLTNKTAIFNI